MKREFPDFHAIRPEHQGIHDSLLNWVRVVRDSQFHTRPQPMFRYYRSAEGMDNPRPADTDGLRSRLEDGAQHPEPAREAPGGDPVGVYPSQDTAAQAGPPAGYIRSGIGRDGAYGPDHAQESIHVKRQPDPFEKRYGGV